MCDVDVEHYHDMYDPPHGLRLNIGSGGVVPNGGSPKFRRRTWDILEPCQVSSPIGIGDMGPLLSLGPRLYGCLPWGQCGRCARGKSGEPWHFGTSYQTKKNYNKKYKGRARAPRWSLHRPMRGEKWTTATHAHKNIRSPFQCRWHHFLGGPLPEVNQRS